MPVNILNFDGYAIDSAGEVYSLDRTIVSSNRSNFKIKGRKLKPSVGKNGYKTVALGRGNRKYVHHLVAETFIGQKPEGTTVSHKDGNKLNNHVDNLIYESLADNIRRNSNTESPAGERNGHSVLTEDDVIHIRGLENYGYGFYTKLAKEFGVSQSTIEAVCKNRSWRYLLCP